MFGSQTLPLIKRKLLFTWFIMLYPQFQCRVLHRNGEEKNFHTISMKFLQIFSGRPSYKSVISFHISIHIGRFILSRPIAILQNSLHTPTRFS